MSIMTAAVIGTIVYWIIYVLDPYIFRGSASTGRL